MIHALQLQQEQGSDAAGKGSCAHLVHKSSSYSKQLKKLNLTVRLWGLHPFIEEHVRFRAQDLLPGHPADGGVRRVQPPVPQHPLRERWAAAVRHEVSRELVPNVGSDRRQFVRELRAGLDHRPVVVDVALAGRQLVTQRQPADGVTVVVQCAQQVHRRRCADHAPSAGSKSTAEIKQLYR